MQDTINTVIPRMTRREMEILKYIAAGLSSKLIAEKLHIAKYTVDNHRKNMLKKTGAKNMMELVQMYVLGLLP